VHVTVWFLEAIISLILLIVCTTARNRSSQLLVRKVVLKKAGCQITVHSADILEVAVCRQTHLEISHLGHGYANQDHDLPHAPPNCSPIDPLTSISKCSFDLSLVLLFPPDGRDAVVQIL
jgi:hypothetical protein